MNSHVDPLAVPFVKQLINEKRVQKYYRNVHATIAFKCSFDAYSFLVMSLQHLWQRDRYYFIFCINLHYTFLKSGVKVALYLENPFVSIFQCYLSKTEDIPNKIKTDAANETNRKKTRTYISEALHGSFKNSSPSIARATALSITCRSADKTSILFTLLPTSHVADTTVWNDIFSVKRGSQASSPCHICLVKRNGLNLSKIGSWRNLKDTIDLRCSLKDGISKAQTKMQQFSEHPFASVSNTFSFVWIETLVDLYAVFRLKSLLAHSPAFCRMLKECLLFYFSDSSQGASAMNYKLEQPRAYSKIQKAV